MAVRKNIRKSGITYTAIIRKGPYRTKPLQQTFDTKGEAEFWKADQERLISMKLHQDPRLAQHVSLCQALDKFAEYSTEVLKKSFTTVNREESIRKHLERLLGADTRLSDIKTKDVADYQMRRIKEKAASSTIRNELSLLSRTYRTARSIWALPVTNPVTDIERVPPAPGRNRFLTELEANVVLNEAKKALNKKFYAFALLLMHTGMRAGEAASLTKDQVNFDKRLITIHKTKTGRPRTIGMSPESAATLKKIPLEDDGYFFLKPLHRTTKTTRLQPGSIFNQAWKFLKIRLAQKHRDNPDFPLVKHFTPHDLRHTAGSHLLKQKVDIRIIAEILGHSTLQMVLRYTHLEDDTKVEYAEKLSHLGTGDQNGERPEQTY
jgi:integrase